MSPISVGFGGVPFLVLRSSRSIAISSLRVCRSFSRRLESGIPTSSLQTKRWINQKTMRREVAKTAKVPTQRNCQTGGHAPGGQAGKAHLGSVIALITNVTNVAAAIFGQACS